MAQFFIIKVSPENTVLNIVPAGKHIQYEIERDLFTFSAGDKILVCKTDEPRVINIGLSVVSITPDLTLVKDFEVSQGVCVDNLDETIKGKLSDESQTANITEEEYNSIVSLLFSLQLPNREIADQVPSSVTLQKIYYGTPGSGKSFKVSREVGETPYRTIFHPDSDYASFVGSYKPVGEGNDIGYSFVEQVFTTAYIDAWKHPEKHVNLVIEEINRGNCAQIFGDLFQLLDRRNGYSEYPVTPNKDLQGYLAKSFSNGEEPFVTHGYNASIEELVKKGTKMVLPSNLSIIATMNTSDQSLFPMDSAFKRRWEWEYVPVCYEAVTEDGNPNDAFGFMIDLGNGQPYRWIDFLKGVNIKIKKATDSEDKQMGNFFIKANVDASTFVNKVMFYLWSEVCKDEYHTTNNFFRYDNTNGEEIEFSFNELYPLKGKALEILSSFVSKMINFGNPNITV